MDVARPVCACWGPEEREKVWVKGTAVVCGRWAAPPPASRRLRTPPVLAALRSFSALLPLTFRDAGVSGLGRASVPAVGRHGLCDVALLVLLAGS